jgi:hypothetical protein
MLSFFGSTLITLQKGNDVLAQHIWIGFTIIIQVLSEPVEEFWLCVLVELWLNCARRLFWHRAKGNHGANHKGNK